MAENLNPTKLEYYEEMWKLQSNATLLSSYQGEDGKQVLILDSTIFHPQGGGQPADTGFIFNSDFKFSVQDVRSKDKIVYHYGFFENSENPVLESKIEKGAEVLLQVDGERRKLNSRLIDQTLGKGVKAAVCSTYNEKATSFTAGHLLDACTAIVGLGHLVPGKGYHFPDGPHVEYKGTVPQNELQSKQQQLELEVNNLIAKGGKVFASVLPYNEAAALCDGCLPDYIPKGSNPRIIKLGEQPGCPCGGTHVSDISEILGMKVSQIRTKKGMTKVFYNVEP